MGTNPSDGLEASPAAEQPDELVVPLDLDPRNVRKSLASAEELKQEGNDHFRAKRWDEAIALYRSALGHLPKRPQLPTSPVDTRSHDEDSRVLRSEDGSNSNSPQEAAIQGQQPPPSELEVDCAKARAVLYANISACYVKLGEHKEIVSACTEGKSITTLVSVNRRLVNLVIPSAQR
uniref:Zn(2)-C6 fungal-type domain-containing protein n=1 Tax=Ganoderma boninense TaxID=34458 RepID=A0A5K1JRE5_9APHY|nr:Zn(2)-C6 fungal-type domain-containing protein [Ganoderma boninense]